MSDSDPLAQVEQLYEQKVAALKAEYEDELAGLKKKHDSVLIQRLLRIEEWIREKLHHLGAPDHEPLDHHIVKAFHEVKQEIKNMGTTLSQQMDDAAARDEAATAKLSADLAAIALELQTNAPAAGSVVTQAQVDRHVAIATALEAAAAAADALVVPSGSGTTPPAHTAQDTSDGTPNGAPRPDGSVRNNFFMDGFDASKPETT